MYTVDHVADIVSSFEIFIRALDTLCLHVHDDLKKLPVWIDNGKGQFVNDRNKLIYVLKHISPKAELSPQETYSCPGVVGATPQTFKLINKVNLAKDDFKAVVLKYNDIFKANPTKPARQILSAAGYGSVKLVQVYRHIPFIDFHPRRIAWSISKDTCNRRVSITQAKEMLLRAGQGEHIEIQLAKLSLLKPKDKLVIYRPIGKYWGINIATFRDKHNHSTNYRIRKESLPLFYLHNDKLPMPEVCFSKKADRNNTGIRIDKKIEDVPFLKSIKAYRYK